MKRNNLYIISVAALLLSTLYSCEKEEKWPWDRPFLEVYSFGKEYKNSPDSIEMILDGNAQRLELTLYDTRNNYMPVEEINFINVGNFMGFVGQSSDIPDFFFATDPKNHGRNRLEYEQLGETYEWFNLQHVTDTDVPHKFIITLPENNTGQLRGLYILAGLRKSLSSPYDFFRR